jgi:magnesium transporter
VNALPTDLSQPVAASARKDFALLRDNMTIEEALDSIRKTGMGEKIIYLYVANEAGQLAGVLPTRRLLTAPLTERVSEVMVKRIIAIPHTASVLDACEFFVLHKFLAFPVVDERRRMVGIVDVSLFTGEVFDIAERERMDEVFEAIGFRISELRDAAPAKAFRYRFPWLLATVGGGTACALLTSAYAQTLAERLVLAFFLTMVLGLGESVGAQAMAVTIQALHARRPTLRWYAAACKREAAAGLLLGAACGSLVALIVGVWRHDAPAALGIGLSVLLALLVAGLLGLSVPSALHALRLDPKIAAGPLTLALADVSTLFIYFTIATLVR